MLTKEEGDLIRRLVGTLVRVHLETSQGTQRGHLTLAAAIQLREESRRALNAYVDSITEK